MKRAAAEGLDAVVNVLVFGFQFKEAAVVAVKAAVALLNKAVNAGELTVDLHQLLLDGGILLVATHPRDMLE